MQRLYNISQSQKRVFEPNFSSVSLTHEVGHDLAHGGSKDEVLEDAGDEGEGHAEHRHHQVADRQREQKGVGDSAHALIDRQHHDDEQVANYAEEEDERVEQDPQCVVPVCHTVGGWGEKGGLEAVLHEGQYHYDVVIDNIIALLTSPRYNHSNR